jgi:hypothetical protein
MKRTKMAQSLPAKLRDRRIADKIFWPEEGYCASRNLEMSEWTGMILLA